MLTFDLIAKYGLPLKRSNRLIVHELIVITVQQRDRRLTGSITGQVAQAVAPPGFELNNPWKVGLLLAIVIFRNILCKF